MLPSGKALVQAVFVISSAATLLLILRRPYLYVRALKRHVRLETYFLGALLGPAMIVASGVLTYRQALGGLEPQGGLNPVGILALFLSMVFISIFLDVTGLFEYFARVALRSARGDGRRLFISLYITVSVLTVFTSNDIVILTFTPFVYYFTRRAGLSPTPYLIAEFFAANTWSMMLYIGNPTNILLASAFDLDFVRYTGWMLAPTVAAGVTNALLLYAIFRKEIRRPFSPVEDPDPAQAITDRPGAVMGSAVLAACIVALTAAPYIGLRMWTVALASALALLGVLAARDSYARMLGRRLDPRPRKSVQTALGRMPWTIVPFVLSLFVMVEALRVYGVSADLGRVMAGLCEGSASATVFAYGTASALSANAINNIPMTVAFASVIRELSEAQLLPAALATVAGSNLGANLTPLGALAGIMWMSILRDKDHEISFARFVGYGLLVTPASLAACLGTLALQMALFG